MSGHGVVNVEIQGMFYCPCFVIYICYYYYYDDYYYYYY